jgi:hypothetical protein
VIAAGVLAAGLGAGVGAGVAADWRRGGVDGSLAETYADLVYGAAEVQMRDFEKAYYERVFVKLEVEEDGATAQATVATPDLKLVLADVDAALRSEGALSGEDYQAGFAAEFIKALEAHPETVTSQVTVEVRRDGGVWKLVPNDAYDTAVTCDLAGLYVQYYEQMMNDYVDQNP